MSEVHDEAVQEAPPRQRLKFALKALVVAVLFFVIPSFPSDYSPWWGLIAGGIALAASSASFASLAISAHDDDWEYTPAADWHVGQIIMASFFVMLAGAVGTGGLVTGTISLEDQCQAAPMPWCSFGEVVAYLITGLYALSIMLMWPAAAWWKWFGFRERRRREIELASLQGR